MWFNNQIRRKETIEQLLERFERQQQTIVAPEEQFCSSCDHRSALMEFNSSLSLSPTDPIAFFWLAIRIFSFSFLQY